MTAQGRERVVLFRCRDCGRWSVARRRPTFHERVVLEAYEPKPADAVVIEEIEGQEHDTGAYFLYGWKIRCGPFDRYVAQLDDPSPRDHVPPVPARPPAGSEPAPEMISTATEVDDDFPF